MIFKHLFKVTLNWLNNVHTPSQKQYYKSHRISISGKPEMMISAAKAFKGDPELYNPEDLLLSSLVSCHMMSYLYVCAQNNIEVCSYTDHAEAILETKADGSGRFTKVTLNPAVVISDPSQKELALALHSKANQLCFIANSCNFPVIHQATCSHS
ncbi:OsmC family protein [Sphingobacterium tabacisoli]|uniref:OsmC family protein n=1 Tax=Sphingobacterium tabacisoli TaxID=2044855 RepID=A0ABW5L7R3_9SPHI|nr:OsmC family protein [Sphingobacterium tabacisoli]